MVFHDLNAKQRTEVMAEENARRVDLQGWDRADFCKLLLVRGYNVTNNLPLRLGGRDPRQRGEGQRVREDHSPPPRGAQCPAKTLLAA